MDLQKQKLIRVRKKMEKSTDKALISSVESTISWLGDDIMVPYLKCQSLDDWIKDAENCLKEVA